MLANAEGVCQAITATLPAAWNLVEVSYAATNFGSYSAAASPSIASFFMKPKSHSSKPVVESMPSVPASSRLASSQQGSEANLAADSSRLGDQCNQSLLEPTDGLSLQLQAQEEHSSRSLAADADRSVDGDVLGGSRPDGQASTAAPSATVQSAHCHHHSINSCAILPDSSQEQQVGLKRKCPDEANTVCSNTETLRPSMDPVLPFGRHTGDHHCCTVHQQDEAPALCHSDARHNTHHSVSMHSASSQRPDEQIALQPCMCNASGHWHPAAPPPAESIADDWDNASVQEQRNILRDIELRRLARNSGTRSNPLHSSGSQAGSQKAKAVPKQTTLAASKFFKSASLKR